MGWSAPATTIVSTDSHANILGAVGTSARAWAIKDIAHAWAFGKVWFEVPATVKVELVGLPRSGTTAKDVGLALLRHFGANGLLGVAAEVYGEYADRLGLDGRLTISSLGTEMGAIIIFFSSKSSNPGLLQGQDRDAEFAPAQADADAAYERTERIDITDLEPLISRPGHPEDVSRSPRWPAARSTRPSSVPAPMAEWMT